MSSEISEARADGLFFAADDGVCVTITARTNGRSVARLTWEQARYARAQLDEAMRAIEPKVIEQLEREIAFREREVTERRAQLAEIRGEEAP